MTLGTATVLHEKHPPWSFNGASLDLDFANGRGWVAPGRNALRDLLTVTRASVGYAEYESGVWLPSASGVARITDKGLLVEEARTNSIRNNSMQGAAAGTPGTLPNNWTTFTALTGLTRTLSDLDATSGVDCMTLGLSGTPSGAGNYQVYFEANSIIAAAVAETWTCSAFLQEVLADPNVSSIQFGFAEYNSGGTLLGTQTQAISVDGTFSRYSHTFTTAQATCAYIRFLIYINFAASAATDYELRVGWPQAEEGAFVTSPIRTTTAAATRAKDEVSLADFGALGDVSEGTIFAEFVCPADIGVNMRVVSINDGTIDNRIHFVVTSPGADNVQLYVQSAGGAAEAAINAGAYSYGSVAKVAGAFATDDFAVCLNGGSVFTDAGGAVPSVDAMDFGRSADAFALFGYLRRVAFDPTRLTDAQLQALTT